MFSTVRELVVNRLLYNETRWILILITSGIHSLKFLFPLFQNYVLCYFTVHLKSKYFSQLVEWKHFKADLNPNNKYTSSAV